MDDDIYGWLYHDSAALQLVQVADESDLDRTIDLTWEALARVDLAQAHLRAKDARADQQRKPQIAAGLEAAQARREQVLPQLKARLAYRQQQWQTEMQHLHADLAAAPQAARAQIAAQVNARQQEIAAANAQLMRQFEGRVTALQMEHDKLAAQQAAAQAADIAALEAEINAARADFEEAQRELDAFARATDAALTDLDQSITRAEHDLAAGRARAAGEYTKQ